jgi:cbb3-type cytochrome oxidase maturation protein
MGIIIILIGFSLTIAVGFFFAFLWAVKSGQFEDDKTPSIRMLFDSTAPAPDKKPKP